MAAESPRKSSKYACNVVRPHSFSDKTVAESVFDFISDVVPAQVSQACGSGATPKSDDKQQVLWIRFEHCDVNDLTSNPNLRGVDQKSQPLLALLGYHDGVQAWLITPNGEAQEVISLRQGPVSVFRVLPTPGGENDEFKTKRPIAAICDSTSAGKPFCGIKFVSLRTGDEVQNASFKSQEVRNIESSKRFVVVVFQEKLTVFNACRLRQILTISGCYPCPGPNVNPIALGSQWLAYADKRLIPVHQSCGGMSGDGAQSYAATVISAAKGAFKGLTMFGEAMVSSVTGAKPAPVVKKPEPPASDENGYRPGIVSVVDLRSIQGNHLQVSDDPDIEGLVAHFHAHANEPVAALAFDPSGILLVTACKLGHNFHVFSLVTHPCSSSLGAVHHLYTLHRGDTTAKVTDIAFTNDSRWVTISTHRGTTHVFPITPYGGSICARTHCQSRVVNRVSRFHKSAGLDEIDPGAAGRLSPVLSSSPGSSGPQENYPSLIRQNALKNNTGNPRLPPYPHPTTVLPLAQLKQVLSIPGISTTVPSATSSSSSTSLGPKSPATSGSSTSHDKIFNVCAAFSPERLWIQTLERRDVGKKSAVSSLFILSQQGILGEYHLEPKVRHQGTEKVSDDSCIELESRGLLQWNLCRSKSGGNEMKLPLPSNSPLLLASEAVLTQQANTHPGPDMVDASGGVTDPRYGSKDSLHSDHSGSKEDLNEHWVSQVEMITHIGPHRRLWMGPQFAFKTYQNPTILSSTSSCLLSSSPEGSTHVTTMDILSDNCDLESLKVQPSRSSPVAMPTTRPAYRRSSVGDRNSSPGRCASSASSKPLYIEAGSYEQSPILSDVFSGWTESTILHQPRPSEAEEDQIRRTLEDAMIETPAAACEGGPNSMRDEVFHDSNETLSSSGSSITPLASRTAELTMDAVYPSSGSSDSPSLL